MRSSTIKERFFCNFSNSCAGVLLSPQSMSYVVSDSTLGKLPCICNLAKHVRLGKNPKIVKGLVASISG